MIADCPAPEDAVLDALLGGAGGERLAEDTPYCAGVSAAPLTARALGWHVQGEHEGLHWVLAEVSHVAGIEAVLPRALPAAVGLVRLGPEGARRSIVDAQQAFALALRRGSLVRFGEEWVAATVIAAGPALDEAGAAAVGIARQFPHLADAVRAFAENGLSVVGAARALYVHANTVIYRLERWRQLTGWDARTFNGLSLSVAALIRDGDES